MMLTGCSISGQSSQEVSAVHSSSGLITHCDQFEYCYGVPKLLNNALGEEDVIVYSTNAEVTPSENRYRIQPYHRQNVPCFPSLTGASDTKPLVAGNGKSTWGRVNYRDGYGGEGWQYPYDPKNIVCKIEGTPPPASVYALCSEKDGKTVVICISQMTDNPQLAEEIFKTFRWTE
jgi:hypothetical protein